MYGISEEAYVLLQAIIEKAKPTKDNYVISVDIPPTIHHDKKKELADELQQAGYIERVDFLGQDKLRCQVTPEGMNVE